MARRGLGCSPSTKSRSVWHEAVMLCLWSLGFEGRRKGLRSGGKLLEGPTQMTGHFQAFVYCHCNFKWGQTTRPNLNSRMWRCANSPRSMVILTHSTYFCARKLFRIDIRLDFFCLKLKDRLRTAIRILLRRFDSSLGIKIDVSILNLPACVASLTSRGMSQL